MRIIPGYDKVEDGWDRWLSNGRVRVFAVALSGGESEEFTVRDARELQTFVLKTPARATSVTVTIVDVYPADPGPNWADDTSIAELHLWGHR